jgi:hypothetical protein
MENEIGGKWSWTFAIIPRLFKPMRNAEAQRKNKTTELPTLGLREVHTREIVSE